MRWQLHLRWALRVVGVGLLLGALWMLNHAAFAAWIAGGPPGPHKLGWERHALHSCIQAVALLLAALGCLLAKSWQPRHLVLALVVFGMLMWPSLHKFWLQDGCLDAGGRWLAEAIECEH